ncbi:HD-GYP domain-containing protein [Geomonas subterranea]|uniref:HD domain-containing protein n=1 Tax=Geomonas subterranea TaxID=2847989 RepID=A0ABX8LCB3_9BACT|nr:MULTISPECIES: HD domain-containing phosphohydrolase [Geomonas]QXE89059.1 HD domain-containing protein [Geomonas subterranea]QXM08822.1 HD domain-containing protein [Geomonas subterranea]
MSEITKQDVQRAAMLFTASIKSVLLYPLAHPAVRQPLQELVGLMGEMMGERHELHLGVVEGTFFIEGCLLVTPNAAVVELVDRLLQKGVDAVTIYAGVTPDDLFGFAALLANRQVGPETFAAELERKGISNVRLGIDELVAGEGEGHKEAILPAAIYRDALKAVRDTMREIDNGRIPSGDWINGVVENMVSVTMEEPTTLLGLAMIKDYDNYTFSHSVNVGILALTLAAFLGLEKEALHEINTAGLLHDIGKTRIAKTILNSPGKLSDTEFKEMKRHAEEGSEIVKKMKNIPPAVAEAVLGHHIRHDRTGYPEWAREMQFGLYTEIVSVADCYDAITTLRTYQRPTLPKEAMEIMHRLGGSSLNADLVEKFEAMMGEYPVGSLVRLDTNEIGVVLKPHPMECAEPSVKILIGARGETLETPRLVSLAEEGGGRYATIIAPVDPLLKNINLATHLLA